MTEGGIDVHNGVVVNCGIYSTRLLHILHNTCTRKKFMQKHNGHKFGYG